MTSAIVLVKENKNYRRIAQEHWGLTDEQMVGMHVHHWPPRALGGQNVPEHLYVCSPTMHHYGWHNGKIGYSMKAVMAGTIGGSRHSEAQKLHRVKMGNELAKRPEKLKWCSMGGFANSEAQKESRVTVAKQLSINRRKKILCVETGEIYCSMNEASRVTNIACSNICACCKGGRPKAGGFTWEYV